MGTVKILRRADERTAIREWAAALRNGATPAEVTAAIRVFVLASDA